MPAPAGDGEGEAVLTSSALGAASLIGAEPLLSANGAELNLKVTPRLGNPLGNLHGGISLCASELVGLAAIQHSGSQLETASVHVVYVPSHPHGLLRHLPRVGNSSRALAGRRHCHRHLRRRQAVHDCDGHGPLKTVTGSP